ncbi:hypothetical protein MRX96_017760 [Rhipicephalus microplus]
MVTERQKTDSVTAIVPFQLGQSISGLWITSVLVEHLRPSHLCPAAQTKDLNVNIQLRPTLPRKADGHTTLFTY